MPSTDVDCPRALQPEEFDASRDSSVGFLPGHEEGAKSISQPSPRLHARAQAANKAAEKLCVHHASSPGMPKIEYADAATRRVSLADIRQAVMVHTPRGARVAARTVVLPPPRPPKASMARSVSRGIFVMQQSMLLPRSVAANAAGGAGGGAHAAGYRHGEQSASNLLPLHLNPTCLEMYLSEEEFKATFKMDKDAFYGLKQWKQRQLKKQAGIF